jgi:hypothetical protein
MKLLIENWREFINEEQIDPGVQLFIEGRTDLTEKQLNEFLGAEAGITWILKKLAQWIGGFIRDKIAEEGLDTLNPLLAFKIFEKLWHAPESIDNLGPRARKVAKVLLVNLIADEELKIQLQELDLDPQSPVSIDEFKDLVKEKMNLATSLREPYMININEIIESILAREQDSGDLEAAQ